MVSLPSCSLHHSIPFFASTPRQSVSSRSTEAPKHRSTEGPKHRSTEAPKHRSTEAPKHRSTEAPKHRSTEAPKHRRAEGPLGGDGVGRETTAARGGWDIARAACFLPYTTVLVSFFCLTDSDGVSEVQNCCFNALYVLFGNSQFFFLNNTVVESFV